MSLNKTKTLSLFIIGFGLAIAVAIIIATAPPAEKVLAVGEFCDPTSANPCGSNYRLCVSSPTNTGCDRKYPLPDGSGPLTCFVCEENCRVGTPELSDTGHSKWGSCRSGHIGGALTAIRCSQTTDPTDPDKDCRGVGKRVTYVNDVPYEETYDGVCSKFNLLFIDEAGAEYKGLAYYCTDGAYTGSDWMKSWDWDWNNSKFPFIFAYPVYCPVVEDAPDPNCAGPVTINNVTYQNGRTISESDICRAGETNGFKSVIGQGVCRDKTYTKQKYCYYPPQRGNCNYCNWTQYTLDSNTDKDSALGNKSICIIGATVIPRPGQSLADALISQGRMKNAQCGPWKREIDSKTHECNGAPWKDEVVCQDNCRPAVHEGCTNNVCTFQSGYGVDNCSACPYTPPVTPQNNPTCSVNSVTANVNGNITYSASVSGTANTPPSLSWNNSSNCIGNSQGTASNNWTANLTCSNQLSWNNLESVLSDLNNLAVSSAIGNSTVPKTCPDVSIEQKVGTLEFTCPANQAGATCSISSGHSFSITNAAASGHPAMNAYASTGSNSWGHFEYPGLGVLAVGERHAYARNDLTFHLNSSKKLTSGQEETLTDALIITGQDANANTSSFASPAYVTVKLKGAPSNQAPTLNKVKDSNGKDVITCDGNKCSVELKLTNPVDYSALGYSVEIWQSLPNKPEVEGEYEYVVDAPSAPGVYTPYTSPPLPKVTGLEYGTTYGFRARATPK